MELVEFLLARIAEDEAVARAVVEFEGGTHWAVKGDDPTYVVGGRGAVISAGWPQDADHIARWDPARVLAECEAKRRIVEQYVEYLSTVRAYRSPRWSDAMNEQDKENARQAEARHRVAEDMVRLLALPYADHPDYRQEWKP